jgi:FAD/FMN-containing dehydrogenase
MAKLKRKDREWLQGRYGDRIVIGTVNEGNIAGPGIVLPAFFKFFLGRTAPVAVFYPDAESDLVELLTWALRRKIPLFPRGKASSGSGAAVPTQKGILVDFSRMRKIVAVDRQAETATVEPGITWKELNEDLASEGLALRLHPAGRYSSTVGGWMAQGGAGLGSYEFGLLEENVSGVRVVLPGGETKDFSGQDLSLVAGAEGTTGLISQVTIRLRKLDRMESFAVAFPDSEGLARFFDGCFNEKLPLWSALFLNGGAMRLRSSAFFPGSLGDKVEAEGALPLCHSALLIYRMRDAAFLRPGLTRIANEHQGIILDDEAARQAWDILLKPLHSAAEPLARVPIEIVVPLEKLGQALGLLDRKINRLVIREGIIVKNFPGMRPEAVILGHVVGDPRKLSYHFVFSLILTAAKVAKKFGGRPYASGLFFAHKAELVLGKERLPRLREFKMKIDPRDILNPNKVFEESLVGRGLSQVGSLEPLFRFLANRARRGL